MVIIFSNPKVREFLMKNGIVYTYRKMHPKTPDGIRSKIGNEWATDKRGGHKIMDVWITPIEPIRSRDIKILRKYVDKSGFACARDWISAIISMTPRHAINGWIYRVVKR